MEPGELMEWLKPVEDPELFISIVDLGLVYEAKVDGGKAMIKMTLTSPGCPAGDDIVNSIKERAKEHGEVEEAEVEIVWEPRWDPHTMASEEAKDVLGIW